VRHFAANVLRDILDMTHFSAIGFSLQMKAPHMQHSAMQKKTNSITNLLTYKLSGIGAV
jgi:hypothetical protein